MDAPQACRLLARDLDHQVLGRTFCDLLAGHPAAPFDVVDVAGRAHEHAVRTRCALPL